MRCSRSGFAVADLHSAAPLPPRSIVMPRFLAPFVCAVAFAFCITDHAHAQDVLLDVSSPFPGDDFGFGIAIGDWDGDGIGDLAIGALLDSTAGAFAGAMYIQSGKDGSVLATL